MKRLIIALSFFLSANTASFAEKVVVIPLGGTTNIMASINWRGEWSVSESYQNGDGVQWEGSSYLCVGAPDCTITPPGGSWDLMAAAGAGGISTESDPTVAESVKDGVSWSEVANRPAGLDDGDDVGISTESDPTVTESVKDGVSWSEVANRPAGLDDGDDVGISTESDPTVLASVKDGISWVEVSSRPAGLDDGDDIGITSEADPQVGVISTGSVPRWNGSSLVTGSIADDGTDISLSGNLELAGSSIVTVDAVRLIHTHGSDNFFAGQGAGNLSTTGANNTASGSYTLYSNTTGEGNTASGARTLYKNTTGNNNTASGVSALYFNTTGHDNIAGGAYALYSNTTGYENTASGAYALSGNTEGHENTASGYYALYTNTTGSRNTASGSYALYSNTDSDENTASGYAALYSNTTGHGNTASGLTALLDNTIGWYNTASGLQALRRNTNGHDNTGSGTFALLYNTTGYENTASGVYALSGNTEGIRNTASGYKAGDMIITGNNNTFIGSYANAAADNLINATAIGNGAVVDGSDRVRIGNASVSQIGGQVAWSNLSDIRHKENIVDASLGLDFINALRPVEYRMNEGNNRTDLGFIAQEVEVILGEDYNLLGIGEDADRTLSLRYTDFIAPLVKAIQEQDEMIREQVDHITNLKERIALLESLVADLK